MLFVEQTRHSHSKKFDSKSSVLSPVSFDTESTIRSLKGFNEVAQFIREHPKLDHKDYGAIFNAIYGAARANKYGTPLLSNVSVFRLCFTIIPPLILPPL